MNSSDTPSPAKKPARSKCEICRDILSGYTIDDLRGESFPDAVHRLERLGGLRRCPLCFTFYLMESGSDPHHYMSAETSITRISHDKALGMLSTLLASGDQPRKEADKAKRWMGKHDVDSHVSELDSKLESEKAAEAAATLADICLQRKDWNKLEGLLRHENSAVRGGALGALALGHERTPAAIIDAVVALLGDKAHARAAHTKFIDATGYGKVVGLITTLVECLDNDDAKIRALAVDSILHYLEPDTGYYIGDDGKGSYRDPQHPKIGAKVAKALYPLLGLLVRHLVKPRPAPWVDVDSYPRSDRAKDSAKELNTTMAAAAVLWALFNSSETSKARVLEALDTVSPELRRIISGDYIGLRFLE